MKVQVQTSKSALKQNDLRASKKLFFPVAVVCCES